MAVGAGSIKRASKLNTEGKLSTAEPAAAKKTTTGKSAVKKTTAGKSAVKKTTEKKTANQACRLTEELPIYLL